MHEKNVSRQRRQKPYTRQRIQERQRQRRRYPYNDNWKLEDFFRAECLSRITALERQLRPYLLPYEGELRHQSRLFFSPESLSGQRIVVCRFLAEAIEPWKDGASPLTMPKSVFFRFLADPAHSNFGVSEKSLSRLCLRALRL